MKTQYMIAIALLSAGLGTGCRETKSEFSTSDTISYQDTTKEGNASPDANIDASASASQNSEDVDESGNAANGSITREIQPIRTQVNKAKAVQVKNRTNAEGKGGYSAPDGTAAENHDGDMYTKHDTTRMPSGSTPIK